MTLLPVAELNSRIEPVQKLKASKKQSDGRQFQPWQQHYLLQAVIESFIDGILILTQQGELVHANTQAHQIGRQLVQGASQPNAVVQEIWRVCESLRESYELFPDRQIIIESEVTFRGRQAPPKPNAKRVLHVLPPRQIPSLLTMGFRPR